MKLTAALSGNDGLGEGPCRTRRAAQIDSDACGPVRLCDIKLAAHFSMLAASGSRRHERQEIAA